MRDDLRCFWATNGTRRDKKLTWQHFVDIMHNADDHSEPNQRMSAQQTQLHRIQAMNGAQQEQNPVAQALKPKPRGMVDALREEAHRGYKDNQYYLLHPETLPEASEAQKQLLLNVGKKPAHQPAAAPAAPVAAAGGWQRKQQTQHQAPAVQQKAKPTPQHAAAAAAGGAKGNAGARGQKRPFPQTGTGTNQTPLGTRVRIQAIRKEQPPDAANAKCPECGLNHTWEHCARNEDWAENPWPNNKFYKGSGPHPWTYMPDYQLGIERDLAFRQKYPMGRGAGSWRLDPNNAKPEQQ